MQRGGKAGQPHFRVVLQEHTDPVKREAQEILGHYNPAINPKVLKLDIERIKYWISKGAKPSDSLAVLLKKEGVEGMEKFIEQRNKKRKKKGEPEEEAPAPAPAPAPVVEAPAVEEAPVEAPTPAVEEAPAPVEAEAPAPAAEEAPVEAPAPAVEEAPAPVEAEAPAPAEEK